MDGCSTVAVVALVVAVTVGSSAEIAVSVVAPKVAAAAAVVVWYGH